MSCHEELKAEFISFVGIFFKFNNMTFMYKNCKTSYFDELMGLLFDKLSFSYI